MKKEKAWSDWLLSREHSVCDDEHDAFFGGWNAAILSLLQTKDPIPFKTIISKLNELTGRNFKTTTATCAHIRSRWREGMREKDFEQVVITKNAQWKTDPKMAIYIRPETLFGTKMESYLNEPPAKKTKLIRNHLGQLVEVEE